MSQEQGVCPYCNGRGMKLVEIEVAGPDGKPLKRDASRPCICTLNTYVSSRHEWLTGICDVTPEDCIEVGKKLEFANYIFYGTEHKFLYVAKAFIVLHYHYNKTFKVLSGADVAQKYAMAQPNGVIPTVTALTDFSLVSLLCVAKINNKAITPGSYEMVANRLRVKKPTWIYAQDEAALHQSVEYQAEGFSETLETLIGDFPLVDVDRWFKIPGYHKQQTGQVVVKRQKANDSLANM